MTKSNHITIPSTKSDATKDIIKETERMLFHCRTKYSAVLDKVAIKPISEVDINNFAASFANLQSSNPLFDGKSNDEDRKSYGCYLWERAVALSPWCPIAVEKDSGKCVGMIISYPAQAKLSNSEYESRLPTVCSTHWNATLDVEREVVKRWNANSSHSDSDISNILLRIAYGGIDPLYRGSVGLYQLLAAETQDSACKAGFTNVWSFTFNPAFYKKIINKSIPFSSLSGIVLSMVTYSLNNLNTSILENIALPTALRILGMQSVPLYCIRTPTASLLTCVWTCGQDPMLAKM